MFRKVHNNLYCKILSYLLIFAVVNCQIGCRTYFVKPISFSNQAEVKSHLSKSAKRSKYFVLHYNDFVKHIHSVEIEGSNYNAIAQYDDLPSERMAYKESKPGKNHVELDKYGIIEETHLKVSNAQIIPSVPDTATHMCHFVLSKMDKGMKTNTQVQIYLDQELIFNKVSILKEKDTAHVCFPAKKGQSVKLIYDSNILTYDECNMQLYTYVCGYKNTLFSKDSIIPWNKITKEIEFAPHVRFNLSDVVEITEYNDQTSSVAVTTFFGVLGAIGVGLVVVLIVAILTKSSCPFVYVANEKGEFSFTGEIFSGAFYPKLERRDVMPLPTLNYSDSLKVILANELMEKQYINEVKCIEVIHSVNSEVLPDYSGRLYELKNLLNPVKATSDSERDLLNMISANDNVGWNFSDNPGNDGNLKCAKIYFENPALEQNAALVINAKNSLIMDHAYYKFTELTGTSYEKFIALQRLKSKKELLSWSENQSIPLTIYVLNSKNEWKLAGKVDVVGPLAYRKLIVPLDLTCCSGNQVIIKIECGAMFWELDNVSISYDVKIPNSKKELPVFYAKDDTGTDIISYIKSDDKKYLLQDEPGQRLHLCYKTSPVADGFKKSYFLSAKGYYEHIRKFDNNPDLTEIKKFKQKNHFPEFTRYIYNSINKQNYFLSSN